MTRAEAFKKVMDLLIATGDPDLIRDLGSAIVDYGTACCTDNILMRAAVRPIDDRHNLNGT